MLLRCFTFWKPLCEHRSYTETPSTVNVATVRRTLRAGISWAPETSDCLEESNTSQLTPLTLFLPSRYLVRVLTGTLPAETSHELVATTLKRLTNWQTIHICWLNIWINFFLYYAPVKIYSEFARYNKYYVNNCQPKTANINDQMLPKWWNKIWGHYEPKE